MDRLPPRLERVDKEAERELGVRVGRQRPARRPVVGRKIGPAAVALAQPVEGEQPARPPAEVCERVKICVAEGEAGAEREAPRDAPGTPQPEPSPLFMRTCMAYRILIILQAELDFHDFW